jgi:hypothetical protein
METFQAAPRNEHGKEKAEQARAPGREGRWEDSCAGEKQNPSQKISVQTSAPARAETEVGKCFGLAEQKRDLWHELLTRVKTKRENCHRK